MPLGHKSIRQLSFGISAVVLWHFDSCFWPRQLFFDNSAVVFCCLGSCFLINWQFFLPARQLFFAFLAVVFCWFYSCFLQPDAHSRSNFNCPTLRQLCFAVLAVVFWRFGCFLIFRQLCFAGSAEDFEFIWVLSKFFTIYQSGKCTFVYLPLW